MVGVSRTGTTLLRFPRGLRCSRRQVYTGAAASWEAAYYLAKRNPTKARDMRPNRSTRIALAGFGAWGQMHARALGAIDGAGIVSVYCHGDATEKAAAELLPHARRFRDYPQMLAAGGFDVVDVTVPNHAHARFAVVALEAGAHVFLEKPLGLDLGRRRRGDRGFIGTRGKQSRSTTSFGFRGNGACCARWRRRANSAASATSISRCSARRFVRGRAAGAMIPPRWVPGCWKSSCISSIWCCGTPRKTASPSAVRAFGNGDQAGGLIDNFTAVLEWGDGSLAVLSQCLSGFEHHTALEIAGERGSARTWWSGAMDRTLHPEFALKVKRGDAEPESIAIPQSGEVFELEENLRQALAGFREGRSTLPPEQARDAIEVCLAAEQAYRSGARDGTGAVGWAELFAKPITPRPVIDGFHLREAR